MTTKKDPAMKTVKASMILSVFALAAFFCSAAEVAEQKKWLVVEDAVSDCKGIFKNDDAGKQFPRLLLMQMSKAGVFHCCDRASYKTQAKELALGENGVGEVKSVGYAISWMIRSQDAVDGKIITVSLGYIDIGKRGNNEVITSEDVVVRECDVKGVDLLTEVARRSAKAILLRLHPPQVVEVNNLPGGGVSATVDFGGDFFEVGEKISFTRRIIRRNREISGRVGVGIVMTANQDSSIVSLLDGDVKDGDVAEVFKSAASSSIAKYKLAMCYLVGEDVPKDVERARLLLEEAAQSGSREAEEELLKLRSEQLAEELESRKETCTACKGVKVNKCEKCKGVGKLSAKNRVPCPTCSNDDEAYSNSSGHKGQIRAVVTCNYCHGTGRVRQKCDLCNGSGRQRVSNGGARLDSFVTCSDCGGRKGLYVECPKCSGEKRVEIWKTCANCQGRGMIVKSGSKTCDACNGRGSVNCDKCNGIGFVYKHSNCSPAEH